MEVDGANEDIVPPGDPSLEEELVHQFGPGVLRDSPPHDRSSDEIDVDGEDEEVNEDEDSQYPEDSINYDHVIDLSGSRHHVSDSEDEDLNPLRTLIRKKQKVRSSSSANLQCSS
jgi:hypothetical protein